jgi:glycosyltransferase involved in cell wall biosynthesis
MRILALNDYYLPGFKAGGPIRSLANIVERLGEEFEFSIVTRDRDLSDTEPYPSLSPAARWQRVRNAQVYYRSPSEGSFGAMRRILGSVAHDVMYLNSFFSYQFAILPLILRRCGLVAHRPVVIAPRGEFSPGALALKSATKRAFIIAARQARLHERVLWQASSDLEGDDIRRWFGPSAAIHVAPNIPAGGEMTSLTRSEAKRPGELKVAFFSRIAEKKNLLGALDLLSRMTGTVTCDIYGTITERDYWQRCEAALAELPSNVRAEYRGPLRNEEVRRVLCDYDVLLFPTFGENFGHVILEALSAGCPVLTSDQTPWRHLTQCSAGWSFPLSNLDEFVTTLHGIMAMDDREHARWRAGAQRVAEEYRVAPEIVAQNRSLFLRAATLQP